jgi:5-methylcytosine-specific restriction endonuclease McrA
MEHVSFRGSNWDQIRRRAYVRDGYRCQVCGVKCISKASSTPATSRNVIQCHHKQKYKGPEDNDLSNLVTLCLGCHAITLRDVAGVEDALLMHFTPQTWHRYPSRT